MKVLHISTSDIGHGAGVSAYRLHDALSSIGCDSTMLVKEKLMDDNSVIPYEAPSSSGIHRTLRFIEKKSDFIGNYLLHQNYWSISEHRFLSRVREASPQVINLHAIHGHRIHFPLRAIRKLSDHAKLVWTLHDMWAFTGHCTYAYACDKWKSRCRKCPDLRSFVPLIFDTTPMNFSAKKRVYRDSEFVVVCPSQWLYELAKTSTLLRDKRIIHIPYGVDRTIFYPRDKKLVRRWLGIPDDHKVILGIAHDFSDPRKGLKYLEAGLQRARQQLGPTCIVLLGRGGGAHRIAQDFPTRTLGYVSDPWLIATVYSAADILVFPTLADNLPNVVLESMACGTPVVSFSTGGLSDMVEHHKNGYLAKHCDTEDLANGILQLLGDDALLSSASNQATLKIEREFGYELQARRYLDLYTTL